MSMVSLNASVYAYNEFIGYGTLVTATFSALGTISIIIPILVKCACFKLTIIQILHISLADFLASVCVLMATAVFLLRDEVTEYCLITSTFGNIFYGTSFVFMILYAAQAFVGIHAKRFDGKMWRIFNTNFRCNIFNGIYLLAWLIPPIIALPMYTTFYHNTSVNHSVNSQCFICLPTVHFRDPQSCKTNNLEIFDRANKYRYVFLAAKLATFLILIGFFSATLIQYYRHIKSPGIFGLAEQKLWNKRKERVFYFIFAFVFCWLVSIILDFLVITDVLSMKTLNPFYVIKSLTNPLHGFLNSIVYGWQRKTFTNIFRRPGLVDQYSQPGYESYSNRNYLPSSSEDIDEIINYRNSNSSNNQKFNNK